MIELESKMYRVYTNILLLIIYYIGATLLKIDTLGIILLLGGITILFHSLINWVNTGNIFNFK